MTPDYGALSLRDGGSLQLGDEGVCSDYIQGSHSKHLPGVEHSVPLVDLTEFGGDVGNLGSDTMFCCNSVKLREFDDPH